MKHAVIQGNKITNKAETRLSSGWNVFASRFMNCKNEQFHVNIFIFHRVHFLIEIKLHASTYMDRWYKYDEPN